MGQEPDRPRSPDGRFAPGGPPPSPLARRRRGTHNKLTADVRDGIIVGAARHGFDGKGLRGFEGYCEYLAAKHPRTYAYLIGKLLPLQVHGSSTPGSSMIVNVMSVPSGHFLTAEQIAELYPQREKLLDLTPESAREPTAE